MKAKTQVNHCTLIQKRPISTMDSNMDKWIEKLRQKISLEEDELVKLCHIVKDILIQESNVVVRGMGGALVL